MFVALIEASLSIIPEYKLKKVTFHNEVFQNHAKNDKSHQAISIKQIYQLKSMTNILIPLQSQLCIKHQDCNISPNIK